MDEVSLRNASPPLRLYGRPFGCKIKVGSRAIANGSGLSLLSTVRAQPRAAKSGMGIDINSIIPGDEQSSTTHFEVTLPADVSAISPVVGWIMRLVGDLEYAAGKEFEIEMALREALANAILHGCKADPAKKIECSVTGDRDRGILIVVRDPGSGFDPASLPSPIDDANLHSEHGRGILLINKLMDEVKHERNGTIIRMRKF
jgi:serine/threonine-protein kinase RsbW